MTDEQKAVERQNLIDILDRNFGYTDDEPAHVVADRLIAAGYRLQSDTVKEVLDKMQNLFDKSANQPLPTIAKVVADWQYGIYEIAASFGGEVEND